MSELKSRSATIQIPQDEQEPLSYEADVAVDSFGNIFLDISNSPTNIKIKDRGNYVLLYFFNFKSGKVKGRTPIKKLNEINNIVDFNYNFNLGDNLEGINSDHSRHAYVIIKAQSKTEITNSLEKLKGLIKINYA